MTYSCTDTAITLLDILPSISNCHRERTFCLHGEGHSTAVAGSGIDLRIFNNGSRLRTAVCSWNVYWSTLRAVVSERMSVDVSHVDIDNSRIDFQRPEIDIHESSSLEFGLSFQAIDHTNFTYIDSELHTLRDSLSFLQNRRTTSRAELLT